MATYTATMFANTPKAIHIGDNSISGQFKFPAASSVGDVVFLAKVPHGATIVGIEEDHTTGATAQAVSFGFARGAASGGGGNASCLIASGAQATVNRGNVLGLPVTVSVSDTDPLRYAELVAKVESGSATTSLIINLRALVYRTDGT